MKKLLALSATALALAGLAGPARALTFEFSFLPGVSAQQQASLTAAAGLWSQWLTDPIAVKLEIGSSALAGGNLAQADARRLKFSYTALREALVADAGSALDSVAVAHLSAKAGVDLLINLTADNPNGYASAVPYLDAYGTGFVGLDNNNVKFELTSANARALGLGVSPGGIGSCADCDALIEFNDQFTWDYQRGDGIQAGAYDFVGIAVHEIGHALGFVSGVDVLDAGSPPTTGSFAYDASNFSFVTPLDLFRFSAQSAALGAIDWAADARDKYFSVDGGATAGALFATGVVHGDGREASHWKDHLGLGVLDPTGAPGELLMISANDVAALDAIGWNISPVPEPATYALMLAGLAWLGWRHRRS